MPSSVGSVLGLGWNAYYDQTLKRSHDLPIDLHFDLRKPMNKEKAVRVKGHLSYVVMRLKYSDYCLLRAALKKTDMSKWDNIEKAYWMEEAREKGSAEFPLNDAQSMEQEVEYSSSARFVRYGTKARVVSRKRPASKMGSSHDAQSPAANTNDDSDKVIDFGFKMDGIRLTLHRDDDVDAEAASEILSHRSSTTTLFFSGLSLWNLRSQFLRREINHYICRCPA